MRVVLNIIPPKNTGQSGKRLSSFGGRARMFETKEAKQTKNMYWGMLAGQKPATPLDGALIVKYYFFFPYNSSVKKSLQKIGAIVPKTTKPDWDNIPKQIQDCMTTLQYWTDDAIIFDGGCVKCYAPQGKIVVDIIPLPNGKDTNLREHFAGIYDNGSEALKEMVKE